MKSSTKSQKMKMVIIKNSKYMIMWQHLTKQKKEVEEEEALKEEALKGEEGPDYNLFLNMLPIYSVISILILHFSKMSIGKIVIPWLLFK